MIISSSPVASGPVLSEMGTCGRARLHTSSWSPNERSRSAYSSIIRFEAMPRMTLIKVLPLLKNAELNTKP